MSMTKGTPASSQIITMERMLEEKDEKIAELEKELSIIGEINQYQIVVQQQAIIKELREALLSISPMAMTNKANEALLRSYDASALEAYRDSLIDTCIDIALEITE